MTDEIFPREDDRLPWLETAENRQSAVAPVGRTIAMLVFALCVIAAIIVAGYWLKSGTSQGHGELIEAAPGDYKVRPAEPGGLSVNGEGNAAIATSQGRPSGQGAIDLSALPERPVATIARSGQPKPAGRPGERTAAAPVPSSTGRLIASKPMAPPVAVKQLGNGSVVQLGAFPSQRLANDAWQRFSKRFAYIAQLENAVQPVVKGQATLYRLRVDAGSANLAADVCGRLRVAGESCFVVN